MCDETKVGPRCSVCGRPATCVGRSAGDKSDSYACDVCCGHYCSETYGECEEIHGAQAVRVEAQAAHKAKREVAAEKWAVEAVAAQEEIKNFIRRMSRLGGATGAQPPAEVPPIETCACGTVWPANRLPAPAFPAHCPACRPGEWAGAMPFLGERIKPIRRALARTLTDAEIDAAEALANGAKPFDPAASWAFYQRARTDVPALACTARAERRRAEEAERERDGYAEALATFDRQILAEKDETRRLRVEVAKLERERDAAKAIADAWAERHTAMKTLRGALRVDAARDADFDAVDVAQAKLAALGVKL